MPDDRMNIMKPPDNSLEALKGEIEQMNKIAKDIMTNVEADRDKTEDLYSFMEDQIDVMSDKNPATREAMAKAVELKMKATDQMIELLKIKAKLLNPNKGSSVNINLGKFDDERGGNTNDMITIVDNLENDKD